MRSTFFVPALALLASALPAQTPTYVESIDGLDEPKLDGGATEVEMGDVNGDGYVDLVSIGDHGSPYINTDQHGVMVWFGDGTGSWHVFQSGTFGYGGVALGDVNGDGLMDVGYGMHHNYSGNDLGDQLLEVALGDGTGTSWTPWDDGLATAGETWGMFGTDFADVDADGDLDIASISFGCCNGVHVYLNQGDGTWVHSWGGEGGNSGEKLYFGEIDGDGLPDLVTSWDGGTVFLGDGGGGFTLADTGLPGGSWRQGVSVGDVDGDGRDDVAWATSAGALEVWRRDEAGAWVDLGAGLPDSGGWQATQLWDMDGDGNVDLVAYGDGRFALWLSDGAGGWTPATSFTTPEPGDVEAFRVGGDADHNGRADIVVVVDEGGYFNSRNQLRFFREASVPDTFTVRVDRPTPGATILPGSVRFIDWATAVPGGEAALVALAWRADGGAWNPIEIGVPNNGRYQWLVPDTLAGDELEIAVAVALPSDRSRVFAVGGPYRIVLAEPAVE